ARSDIVCFGSSAPSQTDGLLQTYHKSLADRALAHRRKAALAARRLDRGRLGYDVGLGEDLHEISWSQLELVVESDVSILRSQLGALPVWDPDLPARLRRWAAAGGVQGLLPAKPWRPPPTAGLHPRDPKVFAKEDCLEACGQVQGFALTALLGPNRSRARCSAAYVWSYRFQDAVTAAAQLAHHPALAGTDADLRT
ncbi:unnamed protein product, partial [Polarella glacialis]